MSTKYAHLPVSHATLDVDALLASARALNREAFAEATANYISSGTNASSSGASGSRSQPASQSSTQPAYPQRPGKAICTHYAKNGKCPYGRFCHFHHPPTLLPSGVPAGAGLQSNRRASTSGAASAHDSNASGSTLRLHGSGGGEPGSSAAPRVSTNGTGSAGPSSTQTSTEAGSSATTSTVAIKFPYLVKPSRPECQIYRQTGQCPYGSKCMNHHDPRYFRGLPPGSGSTNGSAPGAPGSGSAPNGSESSRPESPRAGAGAQDTTKRISYTIVEGRSYPQRPDRCVQQPAVLSGLGPGRPGHLTRLCVE